MTPRISNLLLLVLLAAGCASEDPSIVNPPPGNANVIVRLFNIVPDDRDRQLVMELGYQTQTVPSGMFSATVNAPADSSYVDILADGAVEYHSPTRIRFTRQSVYDIFALPRVGAPTTFDTILVSNANRSLTTQPVAQVRVIHGVPDTTFTLDVRSGCPNGLAITTTPVKFGEASLYRELPPGPNVFSVQRVGPSGTTIVGTYQCTLKEFTPYTIMYYLLPGNPEPQLMLLEESDFTTGAARPLTTIDSRDADIRVFNTSTANVSVQVRKTGQQVVNGLLPGLLSAYTSVPTCEQQEPDVFEMTFSDGRTAVDSTALTVRGRYTLVATDTGGVGQIVIIPPTPVVYGSAGKSIIRVVHAADRPGGMAVSVGARTDASTANGYSSGITLSQDIRFNQTSAPFLLLPGAFPLTVTTSSAPTSVISVRESELAADRSYLLILTTAPDGTVQTHLIDESDQPGSIPEMSEASLLRFVNGSTVGEYVAVSIGQVISNGRVYYRNSLTSSVSIGSILINAGSKSANITTIEGKRTLVIFTNRQGTDELIEVTSDPLRQQQGSSDRRVINATSDVPFVSVAYDTSYQSNPDLEHVAKNVGFGETSPIHVLDRDIRGSMYVYNSDTFETLYTLPIDIGPLGNSYSLIVVGKKQSGYEVIVLQEF